MTLIMIDFCASLFSSANGVIETDNSLDFAKEFLFLRKFGLKERLPGSDWQSRVVCEM